MWDVILEKQIQRELTKLDPQLFLDKEAFEGHVYPVIRYREGEEIYNVLTAPYLSLDMVLQVKAQEGNIREAIEKVKLNNYLKREQLRKKTLENLEEMADEHNKSTGKIRRWFIPDVKPL